MALRLVKPSTRRASLPNFWLKASLRLWAGSVEMSSTERRTLASWMASEHDVVVLPTPPLPPTKIQRSDRWSRIDWSVGSMASGSSTLTSAADILANIQRLRGSASSDGRERVDEPGSWSRAECRRRKGNGADWLCCRGIRERVDGETLNSFGPRLS